MHIESQGIVLFPLELRALLKFCAKDLENPLAVVHFRVEGDQLIAYATNGHRALQAQGAAHEGAPSGEWTVARQFLAKVLTALEAGQYAALQVSAASLHGAVIRHTETFEDVCEVTWPTDAASTQTTFPVEGLRGAIVLPTTERPIRCVSINAEYLADLTLVAKAAGSLSLDLFPGRTRQDALIFQIAVAELDTEWRGAIMPLRTAHPSAPAEPDTPPEPAPGIFEPDQVIEFVDEHGEVRTSKLYDIERLIEERKRKRGRKEKSNKQPELGFSEGEGEPDGGEDEEGSDE